MSRYHRIALIVHHAARELFYHGTSISNLKSILSEGLAGGHRKVWETDKDERSRASFGGTYFTKNFMTAAASAGRANEVFGGEYGDDRVIVIARLETRTPGVRIDEDDLTNPGRAIESALGIAANAFSYMSLADSGYPQMDKIVAEFMGQLSYRWQIDQRMAGHLKQYVPDMIKAYTEREIAIGLGDESEWSKARYLSEFPAFEDFTLADKEAKWRAAAERFMTKAHRLTSAEHDFLGDNVRIDETVAFRGANRIMLIAQLADSDDPRYYSKIRIVYGDDADAVSMLLNDITTRWGENYIAQGASGDVIYDKPKESKAAASTLTFGDAVPNHCQGVSARSVP